MNISQTTNNNLCLGCGLCEDICPSSSIKVIIKKGEYRPIVDESKCLGDKCSKCSKICPGLGVKLKEIGEQVLEVDSLNENKYIGKYLKLYTGHATDEEIRYHSASGGMVTALLAWLFEKGIIQGAVVTRFSSKDHITPEPFIARTKEDLISARSSKYCPVSMQGIRKKIREAEGKYVIVGLPCHIQGFRKIEETDIKFKEHVFAYWGLYCSSGRTFHLTEYVLKERKIPTENINYFAYRDEGCLGSLIVRYRPQSKNGMGVTYSNSQTSPLDSERVHKERYGSYYNLRSYFIPRRCHFCIDHSAELSDISFGDIHIKPYSDDKIGVNSIIVRSPKMLELIKQVENDGGVAINDLDEDVLVASQKMARTKKTKYYSLVYWGKRLGLKVPEYDVEYPRKGLLWSLVYMLNLNLQYRVGYYKFLWPIIKYTIRK